MFDASQTQLFFFILSSGRKIGNSQIRWMPDLAFHHTTRSGSKWLGTAQVFTNFIGSGGTISCEILWFYNFNYEWWTRSLDLPDLAAAAQQLRHSLKESGTFGQFFWNTCCSLFWLIQMFIFVLTQRLEDKMWNKCFFWSPSLKSQCLEHLSLGKENNFWFGLQGRT